MPDYQIMYKNNEKHECIFIKAKSKKDAIEIIKKNYERPGKPITDKDIVSIYTLRA